jgi:hypothetical protein
MTNDISKSLIQEIEFLRIQKQISVRDLVNGITSERSYRRYITGELDVPVDAVFSLTERVNLDFVELLGLVDQHKQIVDSLDQLVKYLRYHDYEKAFSHYSRLKKQDIENVGRKRIVTLFIMKYELETNKIISKTFNTYLQESYDLIINKPINCIGSLYVMVLYYESFRDERINITIMEHILSEHFLKPSYSIYKQLLIDFLYLNIDDNLVTTHSIETLLKVVDYLSGLIAIHEDDDGYIHVHYFYMKLSYLKNDILNFKKEIFKYVMHSKVRLSETDFRNFILTLSEEYKMDVGKIIFENI